MTHWFVKIQKRLSPITDRLKESYQADRKDFASSLFSYAVGMFMALWILFDIDLPIPPPPIYSSPPAFETVINGLKPFILHLMAICGTMFAPYAFGSTIKLQIELWSGILVKGFKLIKKLLPIENKRRLQ